MTTPQLPAKKMKLSKEMIEVYRPIEGKSEAVRFVVSREDLNTLCDMALASLTSTQPQGQEWRAIETAPKDGTMVLFVFKSGIMRVLSWDGESSWVSGETEYGHGMVHAIGWLPLPHPPAQIEEKEEGR